MKGLGYSFVEVIVPCPTGLKKSVQDSYKMVLRRKCSVTSSLRSSKSENGVEIMLVKCMFSGSGGQGSALMAKLVVRGRHEGEPEGRHDADLRH